MTASLTQWVCLLVALALLIQGARGGYRRGPIRQLAGVLALLASALIGWLAGPALGLWLFADSAIPWMFREGAGMVVVALVTWLIALAWLWRAGRRPAGADEAESPVLGSIVGCWTGILNIAILVLALTAWAGLREMLCAPEEARAHWTVNVREELAGLPGAQSLSGFSPWPDRWARIIHKAGLALADPECSKRLMQQDAVRALASHPSFYTAWGDPDVKRLLRHGRWIEAAHHPKVLPLLNDEGFQRQLLGVDMELVLDKSLVKQ